MRIFRVNYDILFKIKLEVQPMANDIIKNNLEDQVLDAVTGGANIIKTTVNVPTDSKIPPKIDGEPLNDLELLNVSGGVLATPVGEEAKPQPVFAPAYSTTYVVKRGDTLSAIALRYHTTVSALQKLNRIGNPDLITEGTTLLIPTR